MYGRIPLSVPDRVNLHLAGLPGSEPAAAFYNSLLRDYLQTRSCCPNTPISHFAWVLIFLARGTQSFQSLLQKGCSA